MRLPPELVPAILVRRLNRFAALVQVAGREEAVHLPNSGRMTELLTPGRPLLLAPALGPGRRTRYDLLLLHYGRRWVGVDSRLPAALVVEALAQGRLAPFRPYTRVRREVRLGKSRIDLLLMGDGGQLYLETKSVNLVEAGRALFPDAPTPRGARHLGELAAARAAGQGAAVVFVVQRGDARAFSPHDAADPAFGQALREAARAGVGVWAYRCRVTPREMALTTPIPVEL